MVVLLAISIVYCTLHAWISVACCVVIHGMLLGTMRLLKLRCRKFALVLLSVLQFCVWGSCFFGLLLVVLSFDFHYFFSFELLLLVSPLAVAVC